MKVLSIKDDKITTKGELIEYPSELIGGRNLLPLNNLKGYISGNLVNQTSYSVSDNGIISVINNPSNTLPGWILSVSDGTLFTISGETTSSRPTMQFWYRAHDIAGNITQAQTNFTFPVVNNKFKHTRNFIIPVDTTYLHIGIGSSFASGISYDMRIKLEKGNKATDWTPAPEDIGLSYPDWVTNFAPSISENGILAPEFNEYPEELIGGRNLYLKSQTIKNYKKGSDYGNASSWSNIVEDSVEFTRIIPVNNGNFYFYPHLHNTPFVVKQGESYTVSFEYRHNEEGNVGLYNYLLAPSISRQISPSESWNKFTATYIVTENKTGSSYLFGFTNLEAGQYFDIKNLKLEKGNKATDWTPAPEDLGYSYPDSIQNFGVSFTDKHILAQQFNENENL